MRVKAIVDGILALLLLLGIAAAAAFGIRWVAQWMFDGVDPSVSATVVAAATTVFVSVLSVMLARFYERRQKIELEIRERKVPVYQKMVEGLVDGVMNASKGDTRELEALVNSLTPQLITWASDDVIKAWKAFKLYSGTESSDPIQVMFEFEKVLQAVRIDLGHKRGDLAKGDLLGLFVSDIHKHLPTTKG